MPNVVLELAFVYPSKTPLKDQRRTRYPGITVVSLFIFITSSLNKYNKKTVHNVYRTTKNL